MKNILILAVIAIAVYFVFIRKKVVSSPAPGTPGQKSVDSSDVVMSQLKSDEEEENNDRPFPMRTYNNRTRPVPKNVMSTAGVLAPIGNTQTA